MKNGWIGTMLVLAGGVAAAADEAQPSVEKCSQELGTLAVAEQPDTISRLRGYGLGSPTMMLRMIVQESGCFAVVERGAGMQAMQQERAMAATGQLTADANIGGGQMQAADFVLTASVQFSEETGGVGGAVSGLLGRAGGLLGRLGGLAGGVKFKEAQTTILVSDVRSGIQVASGEGQASKMNFTLGGWGWGGLGWATAGGYSKSPEGKLIAASLLDNYNKVVLQVRDKPMLVRARSDASIRNAAASTQATPQTQTVSAVTPSGHVVPVAPAGAQVAVAQPRVIVAHPQIVSPQVVAVAPQVVAPQIIVTQSDRVLPTAMVGSFSGKINGDHQGVISLIVSVNGRVSGIVQSAAAGGSAPVNGVADAAGNFVLISSGNPGAPTAQFSGRIDPSGVMIGTWLVQGQNMQGTFNARRD